MTKSNSLINEKSPYLLQHAHNPVDWYAWGEEAFEKARREDKPIFLSIGYSTCYWCHVMEREVFENEKIAAEMNRIFVNIKVDREERPDVDRVYMTALQSMSGSGGWPMSMFLDTELRPFYGATYIPPAEKFGMGGFEELIGQLDEAWKTRRAEITKSGTAIVEHIRNLSVNEQSEDELSEAMLLKGAQQFKNGFDEDYGGFGGAPKFPRPVGLNFLLHMYKRFEDNESLKMVIRTLLQMARGGVYDHLGGGFHRYSVDKFWRVPHFEKMLYDQAQLAVIYTDAFIITNDKLFADTAKDVLAYVSRMLTHANGGFFSAEDAESVVEADTPEVKEEGACYVWEYKEVEKLLGEDAEIFCYYYGIEKEGNSPAGSDPHGVFTDKNILYKAHTFGECSNKFELPTDKISEIIEEGNKILFEVRQKRPMPHLDDKILTSWNGLMISAYAKAYKAFGESAYLDIAKRAAEFILQNLYDSKSGTLKHRWRDGEARFDGSLDDYAFFTQALIDLYEASFDIKYLETASHLAAKMIDEFYDTAESGFFDTSGKDKSILVKTKEDYDSAEPTGNSIAILSLLRLGEILGKEEWKEIAEDSIRLFSAKLTAQPYAMPQMLAALDFAITKPMQIVLSGPFDEQETQEMIEVINGTYNPGRIVIYNSGGKLLEKWSMYTSDKPAAFVCENYSCRLPVHSANELKELLHN